jgi:steroid delta-isomerase
MAPTPEQIRATLDTYVAAYRDADKQAAVGCFRPDAVWHDPVGQPPHVGSEGIGEFWDQARTLAQAIEILPRSVYVCGDEAAMVFDIVTTIGDAKLTMEVVETFRFDADARIAEARAYWDAANMRPLE